MIRKYDFQYEILYVLNTIYFFYRYSDRENAIAFKGPYEIVKKFI